VSSSVVAHDNQIEQLIQTAKEHERIWRDLQAQWRAYLRTLPRQ